MKKMLIITLTLTITLLWQTSSSASTWIDETQQSLQQAQQSRQEAQQYQQQAHQARQECEETLQEMLQQNRQHQEEMWCQIKDTEVKIRQMYQQRAIDAQAEITKTAASTQQNAPGLGTIPNMVGQSLTNAQTSIVKAGLTVGDVYYECSDTVERGGVLYTNPAGGLPIDLESRVNLHVSTGKLSGISTTCSLESVSEVSKTIVANNAAMDAALVKVTALAADAAACAAIATARADALDGRSLRIHKK